MKCKDCHTNEATEYQGRYCKTCLERKEAYDPRARFVLNFVLSFIAAVIFGLVARFIFGDWRFSTLTSIAVLVFCVVAIYAIQNPPRVPDFQWHAIRGTNMASVTVHLPLEVLQAFQHLAAQRGLSESQMVVQAFRAIGVKGRTLFVGELKQGRVTNVVPTDFETIRDWQTHPGFSGGQWKRRKDMDQPGYDIWEFCVDSTASFFAVDAGIDRRELPVLVGVTRADRRRVAELYGPILERDRTT